MPRFFYFAGLTFSWLMLLIFTFMVWSNFSNRGNGGIFLLWVVLMFFVYASAGSHLRRVKVVNGTVTASALANRQRRQIEVPMSADKAFDLLDAAVRALPNVVQVVSVRETLQVHAKVRRVYPIGATVPMLQRMLGWFGTKNNQVYGVITPHSDTSTVNLSCEPESGAWRDWFTVDGATNLENAMAVSRAMSLGTTEVRQGEKAATRETVIEKELAIAKLNLLHAQVEPHFLYNTLGSAKYLIRSDPAGAERIIDNLILYLRHSLPRLDNSLTTLGEELDRVRAYLEIMQIRMGARLNTETSVPDALKSIPFPTMMLQTLVENAIKHGLEPKSGGGTIWVLAVDKAGRVAITVADDGNGLSTETTGSGIGLKNVRERLHLAYGAEATFDIAANFPTGVAATITVPVAGPTEVRHD